MAKDPDLCYRFDTALARLQGRAQDPRSDRQRPIVQRSTEAIYAKFSPSTQESSSNPVVKVQALDSMGEPADWSRFGLGKTLAFPKT